MVVHDRCLKSLQALKLVLDLLEERGDYLPPSLEDFLREFGVKLHDEIMRECVL